MYPGKFLGKNIFWYLYNLSHFFGLWSKKRLIRIFFPGCHNYNPRVQRHFLGKVVFFEKVLFVHLFWILSNFFGRLTKKKSGCRRSNPLIQKKLQEKICRKIVFFIFFGLRAEKFEKLDKNTCRIVKTTFKLFRGAILGRSFQMKKLCSSFLVVERNYWTSGWNFLSNFSKLLPTGAAERFDVFFGEKSNCLIIFGLWEKKNRLSAKNSWHLAGLLKVRFTCPQQNFEKRW